MPRSTVLTLGLLALASAYAALVAWYALGLTAWRGHCLYAPTTWQAPVAPHAVKETP